MKTVESSNNPWKICHQKPISSRCMQTEEKEEKLSVVNTRASDLSKV